MDRISNEQVQAQVRKFWNVLSGKSQDRLEEMYSPDAIVFTGRARRPEPAALAAARRQRQLSAGSDSGVELSGVDVQIISDVAVVSYTYQYHSMTTRNDGQRVQKRTMFGRATQIFKVGDRGALEIVHEHLSAGEMPAVEKAQK